MKSYLYPTGRRLDEMSTMGGFRTLRPELLPPSVARQIGSSLFKGGLDFGQAETAIPQLCRERVDRLPKHWLLWPRIAVVQFAQGYAKPVAGVVERCLPLVACNLFGIVRHRAMLALVGTAAMGRERTGS